MAVRYKCDWWGLHLIIPEGQPCGIALARGGAPTWAIGGNPSCSVSTEGGHHLIRAVSTAIRVGKASKWYYLACGRRTASGVVDAGCVRVVEMVYECGRGVCR